MSLGDSVVGSPRTLRAALLGRAGAGAGLVVELEVRVVPFLDATCGSH